MMRIGSLCSPCTSHADSLHARLWLDASSSLVGGVANQLKYTTRCWIVGSGFRVTYLTTVMGWRGWVARFCRRPGRLLTSSFTRVSCTSAVWRTRCSDICSLTGGSWSERSSSSVVSENWSVARQKNRNRKPKECFNARTHASTHAQGWWWWLVRATPRAVKTTRRRWS